MPTFTKAAREKMAARMMRAAKHDAKEYTRVSVSTLSDRPTAGHFAKLAQEEAHAAERLKDVYFKRTGNTSF